jgi:ribosomal protein L7/L12
MRVCITKTVLETVADTEIPPWVVIALEELVRARSKIGAIKVFRMYMRELGYKDVGLKEAKEFIEANFRIPEYAMQAPPQLGDILAEALRKKAS